MAFLVTARFESVMRFTEFRAMVEIAINEVLTRGAAEALRAVEDAAYGSRNSELSNVYGGGDRFNTRRVSPGRHLYEGFNVYVRRAFGANFGYGSIVVWTDNPNAIWQELGTRGRRRKKLKSGEQRGEFPFRAQGPDETGNGGVKPAYFMRRAFRKVEGPIIADLQAALARVGQMDGFTKVFDTVAPSFIGKR